MWKLICYGLLTTCLAAYMIITRQHFWDIGYYLTKSTFWSMYCITVPMLWLYMLVASICYNIFMVYLPWSINRLPYGQRRLLFFVLSFVLIVLLHLGQMDLLFRMKDYTIFSSGYIYKDVFFFLCVVMAYQVFLYKRPDLSIFNTIIWNLFRRGIRIGMDSFSEGQTILQEGDGGYTSMTLPMAEEQAIDGQDLQVQAIGINRIRVYTILLMFFSKQHASYMVDRAGNRIFINHTSTVIKGWKASPWFVKVSKNVYLNMWYFRQSPYSDVEVLIEEAIGRHALAAIKEWDGELSALLTVSERCKVNIRQHFEHREQLDETGWEEYFYY